MSRPTEAEAIARSLAALFDDHPLIEAFTPLRESRLWALNTAYWGSRGLSAFTEGSVPYIATSDGALSAATARLVAARARAMGRDAPRQMAVVEIGPGNGLFARLAMRRYAELRAAEPALPPLFYMAVDGSKQMIEGLRARGILSVPGCEAVAVQVDLTGDLAPLRAALTGTLPPDVPALCVCNYSLDSLPATALRWDGDGLLEAQVELRARSAGADAEAPRPDEVLVRTRFRPAAEDDPALAVAQRFLAEPGAQIPFNAQAIAVLRLLAGLDGRVDAVLVNDYAIGSQDGAAEPLQYFDGSIAVGLHFPTLEAVATEQLGWTATAPAEASETIVSRLFTARPDPAQEEAYAGLFSLRAAKRAHGWVSVARHARSEGRHERALCAFEAALEAAPWNWSLLVEVAHFVQSTLGRDAVARELAERVLEANPLCSQAWNILGDGHYRAGEREEARAAFERALHIQSNDARALLNLAYCDAQDGDLEAALVSIARGLAADRGGALTSELLARQQEIVSRLSSPGTPPAAHEGTPKSGPKKAD